MLKHTHMSIIFINRIYSCRSKMDRSLILWKLHYATSYVAATFHPTIGQRSLNLLAAMPPPSWA